MQLNFDLVLLKDNKINMHQSSLREAPKKTTKRGRGGGGVKAGPQRK